MNSYASVDSLPCVGSPAILTGLLREELGFQGAVVADYWAVTQLQSFHRVAATSGEAAGKALTAGLDMELPAMDFYGEPLKTEVEAGRVSQEVLDTPVRRMLRLKSSNWGFSNSMRTYLILKEEVRCWNADAEFQALVREVTAGGAVVPGWNGGYSREGSGT